MYEDDDTDMALAHFTTGVTCVTAGLRPIVRGCVGRRASSFCT